MSENKSQTSVCEGCDGTGHVTVIRPGVPDQVALCPDCDGDPEHTYDQLTESHDATWSPDDRVTLAETTATPADRMARISSQLSGLAAELNAIAEEGETFDHARFPAMRLIELARQLDHVIHTPDDFAEYNARNWDDSSASDKRPAYVRAARPPEVY